MATLPAAKFCQCEAPGFCRYWEREQTEREWNICQGNCPAQQRLNYYEHWEQAKQYRRQNDAMAHPGFFRRVKNFSKAIVRHVKDKRRKTPTALVKRRLAICSTCRYNVGGVCRDQRCGCQVKHKARWLSEQCPQKKWPNDESEEEVERKNGQAPMTFVDDPNHPDQGKRLRAKSEPSPPDSLLFNSDKKPDGLRDIFQAGAAFLICSGPSLDKCDLSVLNEPGMLTMAVNNAAVADPVRRARHRVNLWTCVDSPGSFCEQIWLDPGIWKFVPEQLRDARIAFGTEDGRIETIDKLVKQCPSILYYRREADFWPETFLYSSRICWGNPDNWRDPLGLPGARSVMFVALRILFHLGVRMVYLLGCDFRMSRDSRNYAFEQYRSKGAVESNNHKYNVLNARFAALLPYFEKERFRIFNCTPNSGLRVFPHVDYEQAVASVTSGFPKWVVTEGRYERKKK